MLKSFALLATALACASAFAPGSVLPTRSRAFIARSPTMQANPDESPQARLGSLAGGLAGRLGSIMPQQPKAPAAPAPTGMGTQRVGSVMPTKVGSTAPVKVGSTAPSQSPQARLGSIAGGLAGRLGSLVPQKAPEPTLEVKRSSIGSILGTKGPATAPVRAAPRKAAAPPAPKVVAPPPALAKRAPVMAMSDDQVYDPENLPPRWELPDGFGSPYDRNPPYSEWMPSPLWAREAEIKHGRVAMTAVLGLVVQELAPRGVPFDWYEGERVLALHDKLVKVGAAWQLLCFIGLFELFWLKLYAENRMNGSGDYGLKTYFDPLGLAKDEETFAINRVKETKNGRLAMISFAGIVHHYLITGKGPLEFITAPPLANCVGKASTLPGAWFAENFAPGPALDLLCK